MKAGSSGGNKLKNTGKQSLCQYRETAAKNFRWDPKNTKYKLPKLNYH